MREKKRNMGRGFHPSSATKAQELTPMQAGFFLPLHLFVL
jgi:hypothetical protein